MSKGYDEVMEVMDSETFWDLHVFWGSCQPHGQQIANLWSALGAPNC